MDFGWSEEQMAFRQRVIEFARNELADDVVGRDAEGRFPHELWARCARFGFQSFSVPEVYSGKRETAFMTAMLAMEALGYACRDNGLAFALNAQIWTVQLPLAQAGTEEQKRRFLPGLSSGELIGAHALSEPESGSDCFALRTRAVRHADGYVLSGRKRYVSLGPIADVVLVFATIDPELGKWGITAFLVESTRSGFRRGAVQSKMGLRTVPIGELELEDCFVPETNRLGPEGAGVGLSQGFLEWERCCILASQIGAMQRQLEESVSYAKTRRQFGQPIGKNQAVSHRIVEMKLRLETARLLLYHVAWLKHTGKPAKLETALLKLYLSECFVASSFDAVRIHGGMGYMTDAEIERDLRDAVGGVIYAGTSDIQRNIVAGLMGL